MKQSNIPVVEVIESVPSVVVSEAIAAPVAEVTVPENTSKKLTKQEADEIRQ